MKYLIAIALGCLVTVLIVLLAAVRFTYTLVWNYPITTEEAKQCTVASRDGQDFVVFQRNRWLYTEGACGSMDFLLTGERRPGTEEWFAAVDESINRQSERARKDNVPEWMIPAPTSDLGAFAAAHQCSLPNCGQWFNLVAYGFPFRCAWGAQIVNDCPGNRTCAEEYFGVWNIQRSSPGPIDQAGIPHRVLVLGLMGNVAVWSGVMFECVTVAHRTAIAVRARVRRARGLCEGCAYPTPASTDVVRCPECGRRPGAKSAN